MNVKPHLKSSWFREGIDEASSLKPFPTAIIIAIVYVSLVSLYIFISGKMASGSSITVTDLEIIELLKGLTFTGITGVLLFLASYLCFKKIAKQDNLIIAQNKNIIATERLVTAGIFSSSVCHDINNIMSVIIANYEFLMDSKNLSSGDKELIVKSYDSSQKIIELTRRMMNAGREYIPGQRSLENLSMVIKETIEFAKIHRKLKNCNIVSDIQSNLFVNINSVLIGRAVMNLILNAADATNEKGKILIRLFKSDNFVVVEIHDDGEGITDDVKEKIFEPFYTTKTDGNGLGLLSLKICAHQHNGIVNVKRSHLNGACFSLTFPIDEKT